MHCLAWLVLGNQQLTILSVHAQVDGQAHLAGRPLKVVLVMFAQLDVIRLLPAGEDAAVGVAVRALVCQLAGHVCTVEWGAQEWDFKSPKNELTEQLRKGVVQDQQRVKVRLWAFLRPGELVHLPLLLPRP